MSELTISKHIVFISPGRNVPERESTPEKEREREKVSERSSEREGIEVRTQKVARNCAGNSKTLGKTKFWESAIETDFGN